MIEFLFQQYKDYPTHQIILEFLAMLAAVLSVWFAKKNNIWVYPIGLISTSIYVYLLFKWSLLGDMIVNFYYSILSLFGWFMWSKGNYQSKERPITKSQRHDFYYYLLFFLFSATFIVIVYIIFNKFDTWYSYIDTFTSAVFFVAMWAMAKRKIEHWWFWIVGNIVSIPLYFLRGYTITSLQYLIFLVIAFYGYKEWIKIYNISKQKY